jgi:hypothetical protein
MISPSASSICTRTASVMATATLQESTTMSCADLVTVTSNNIPTLLSTRTSTSPLPTLSQSPVSSRTSCSATISNASKRLTLSTKMMLSINGQNISVRAQRIAITMYESLCRRTPALHDMYVNEEFTLRALMEVIENEVQQIIQVVQTGMNRHLNYVRWLEGILYFIRHGDQSWKQASNADKIRLRDLYILFCSLWLFVLSGLNKKKQLTNKCIDNLSSIIAELIALLDDCIKMFGSFGDIPTQFICICKSVLSKS